MNRTTTKPYGKMRQRVMAAMALLAALPIAAGCTKDDTSRMLGTWDVVAYDDNGRTTELAPGLVAFTFRDDNTGTYDIAAHDLPERHQDEMHLGFSYTLRDNYRLTFTFDADTIHYPGQGLVGVDDTAMVWRREPDHASEYHYTHLRKRQE